MKKSFFVLSLFVFSMIPGLRSQTLDLPRVSPKAAVSYTIGLTRIDITYGAPAVGGRTIWGNVVPYDQVWRAGANEATTVSFSTDVNLEGQSIKAGKYALFLIPDSTEWTVILNKKWDQWGAYSYDESEDEVRFTVEPKMNEGMQERLLYAIHDMKMDMGYIKLSWEKMRLYLRFKVDVMDQAMSNIITTLGTTPPEKKWIVYAQGADFLVDADGNMDQALEWAKLSTDQFSQSWNWYVRSKVEAKKQDYSAAVISGTKSIELGLADTNDNYYEDNKTAIDAAVNASLTEVMTTATDEKKWIVYAQGANILVLTDGDLDKALEWAKLSTDLRSQSWNWYVRPKAEAKKGDYTAAVASGARSTELGLANTNDKYYEENKEEISNAVKSWSSKLN